MKRIKAYCNENVYVEPNKIIIFFQKKDFVLMCMYNYKP